MVALLDRKELPCLNEESVLHATLRWLTHDVTDRKKHAFHLLSAVRFRSITVKDLDNAMALLPEINDKAFAVVMASLRQDLSTGSLFRFGPLFLHSNRLYPNSTFCAPMAKINKIFSSQHSFFTVSSVFPVYHLFDLLLFFVSSCFMCRIKLETCRYTLPGER